MLDVRFLAATVMLIWLLVALAHTHAHAEQRKLGIVTQSGEQQTFRDERGRSVGTVTTDSVGNKTYRDERGRTLGTATPEGKR